MQTSLKSTIFAALLIAIAFLNIQSVLAPSEPFTITEHTDYGLTENIVHVSIKENLGKQQTINISNIFKNDPLTAQISYKDVLLNQSYPEPVYGWVNSTQQIKSKNQTFWNETQIIYDNSTNTTSYVNVTMNKTDYLDASDNVLICDSITPDEKTCNKKTWLGTGFQTKYDYLPIPELKEKVVISGLKIEQKQEGIQLPKDSTIQVKYTVKHPIAVGVKPPDDVNKYDIRVCSLSGECSTLDPTWWNSSYYKTPLLINNTGNASVLTDFQVLVNVTYNSTYMDANFTSFHLVNETSGQEQIGKFWIDRNSSVNGSYANVWLNLSSIPASVWDNTTYALYHRNVTEVDGSNGTNTFFRFDDFEGAGKLTWINNAGTWANNGGYRKQTDTASYDFKVSYINISEPNYVVHAKFKAIGSLGANTREGLITSKNGDNFGFGTIYYNDNSKSGYHWNGVGWNGADSMGFTAVADTWYDIDMLGSGDNYKLAIRPVGASLVWKSIVSQSGFDTKIAGLGGGLITEVWYDDFYVRKYASPEPTVQTGATESAPNNFIPPIPVIGTVTTGNFWKNITFSAGSGNITNNINLSRNGTWYNGTDLYLNTSCGVHGWCNDTLYAWNSSGGGTLSSGVTNNTQIPNNPITISGVSTSYTLNEGQSLTIDANYTDADSDVGIFATNLTLGSIDSGTGIYTLNSVVGNQGVYNGNISVKDNNGSTSVANFTLTINYQLVPATEPSGVYAFRNGSIPSNATILNYKNNNILTTVITLDWDNITSGDWNTTKGGINYSYTNGIRTALRLNLGGDYTNTGVRNNTKNNITTYFPDLTADPFQSDVQWIELNFTNSTSTSADKREYANLTAKNISEKSANKFPVYTVESITGLDGDYVKSSPLIYLNITNNSDFISQESITTRGNTTLSRVYSGNESVLPLVSYYKTGVFNKLRGTIRTSHPTESYTTYVNNGSGGFDLILYNNLSSTQNRTIANQVGTFLDTNSDIMRKLTSSGTIHFNVSAENFTYILNESISKIILNETAHQVYGSTTNYNDTFVWGTSYSDAYIYASDTVDIKTELYDPTYIKTPLSFVHYEWINASLISNYSDYKYIVVSDKNPTELNNTINRSNVTYGYIAVADYADNSQWESDKKNESEWWTSKGFNVFIDGLDYSTAGNNFATRFKRVVDHIRINNSKKVILNTYTAYQDFATYGDGIMKESAFSRWDGSVSNPTYSWEDMSLEKQRADYYSSHNIPVIATSFGDADDYEKMIFDYYAFAVLYGANGNNSFRYGQPNFQTQREIRVPDLGTMLETGYTETSSTDWNRLYAKGRVHINPITHTYWVDNNKAINSISVDLYLYSGATGSGDRNVTLTINKPNGTFYNLTYGSETTGQWFWKRINISTSEYKEHGQYKIYFATRPIAGGWNNIGEDNTAKTGTHSWYDLTSTNINAEGNESNFTWQAVLGRDKQWMAKLNVNYNTTLQIDTLALSTISQTDSRSAGNRTVTISSSNEYNISIYSLAKQLITTAINNIWFKNSTGSWISANLPSSNVSDINATNPTWTETIIDGFTYGAIKQYISANLYWVKFLFPHLSTQEVMVGENVAPTISNVTAHTANENNTVYVDIDGSDANGDPLTFSTNRSDLFTDFNTTTGKGNWTTNFSSAGTHYVNFGVSDGITNTNETMTITITNIPLSITAFQPSSDPSVAQNTAQAFNITLNRSANVTWLVNGTQAHVNTSVTISNYTNNGSTAGNFNITTSVTDGVDTVSRMWNLTVTAPSQESTSTSSSTGGTSGGYTPEGLEELEESRNLGRKDYSFRIIFEGADGQVEPPKSEEHGIIALNLFFETPTRGTYTFILSTYTDYKPRLNGSLKYFSISPTFDLKPTSSIELTTGEATELYQLYGETWKKLPKGAKVSKDKYRFPVTSFGVFAVMPEGKQEVKANIMQPKQSIFDFNFNASQMFKNIQERDRNAYGVLKARLAWLVEAVEGIKALISVKLNNLL